MPRPGQLKSSVGERFSGRIAWGVLTRAFPPELSDEVIADCGRVEKRHRLLPARVVVYFVLAMCLFSGQGYEEVARLIRWLMHHPDCQPVKVGHTAPVGETGRSEQTDSRPRPTRVPEPAREDRISGRCTGTVPPRARPAAGLEKPPPGHPP